MCAALGRRQTLFQSSIKDVHVSLQLKVCGRRVPQSSSLKEKLDCPKDVLHFGRTQSPQTGTLNKF